MSLKSKVIGLKRNFELITKKFDVIIYSEFRSDLNHTQMIIKELKRRNLVKFCYLTSDPFDNKERVKQKLNFEFEFYYISDGIFRTFIFNFLIAKYMVLTMTDLGNKYLKKSINVKKYLYIFHSVTSTHMCYLENAFDKYDVIFCVGKYQVAEIKKREKVYKLKGKKLLPYFHSRINTLQNIKKRKEKGIKKNIIICSTWGNGSISETLDNRFIISLLKKKYNIFFQLHKMSEKRKSKLTLDLDMLKKKFKNFNFSFQYSSAVELSAYSIMISEWSGAATEFSFGFRRPVIFIDLEKKIRNKNFEKLDITPFEVMIRSKIGKILRIEEIDNIDLVVENLLDNMKEKEWEEKIKNIEKKYFFNSMQVKSQINEFFNQEKLKIETKN